VHLTAGDCLWVPPELHRMQGPAGGWLARGRVGVRARWRSLRETAASRAYGQTPSACVDRAHWPQRRQESLRRQQLLGRRVCDRRVRVRPLHSEPTVDLVGVEDGVPTSGPFWDVGSELEDVAGR
jgi:hypothetical protein